MPASAAPTESAAQNAIAAAAVRAEPGALMLGLRAVTERSVAG